MRKTLSEADLPAIGETIRDLSLMGKTDREISRTLKIPEVAVYGIRHALGIKKIGNRGHNKLYKVGFDRKNGFYIGKVSLGKIEQILNLSRDNSYMWKFGKISKHKLQIIFKPDLPQSETVAKKEEKGKMFLGL